MYMEICPMPDLTKNCLFRKAQEYPMVRLICYAWKFRGWNASVIRCYDEKCEESEIHEFQERFFLGRGSQEWEISFHFSGSRRDDRMKRDVDTRYGNPSDNPNVLQAMRRMTSVDFGRSGISFPHPPCIAIDILGLISSMNVRESNVHSRIIWTF